MNLNKFVGSSFPNGIWFRSERFSSLVLEECIENGEIKTPLRDVSLSGNILETLKNIDAVGNDFKLSVGFCGKDGQTAPVGDGGPHTRILNALVGGMG